MSYYFISIGGTGGNVTLHPMSAIYRSKKFSTSPRVNYLACFGR